MKTVVAILTIATALAIPAGAAQNYLGSSGNMLTPDASTIPKNDFAVGYYDMIGLDFEGTDQDLQVFLGNYGLLNNAEVGLSWADPEDTSGTDIAINGKWRIVDQATKGIDVAVGVLDLFGNAFDDDPTFYFLVGGNLTKQAADVAGKSKPLIGTIGFGSGLYDGLFAGLNWTFTPRASVMAEYMSGGESLNDNDMVNVGVRYMAVKDLQLDLGWVDFSDVAFGASYAFRF